MHGQMSIKCSTLCFEREGYKRSFTCIEFHAFVQVLLFTRVSVEIQEFKTPTLLIVRTIFKLPANRRQMDLP
jgi:hypothetical protein